MVPMGLRDGTNRRRKWVASGSKLERRVDETEEEAVEGNYLSISVSRGKPCSW